MTARTFLLFELSCPVKHQLAIIPDYLAFICTTVCIMHNLKDAYFNEDYILILKNKLFS